MSRSRRKHPIVNICKSDDKDYANRKVRNTEDLPSNPGAFKKIYDLKKWRNYWTEQDAIDYWNSKSENSWIRKRYPTLEAYLNYYRKSAKRK